MKSPVKTTFNALLIISLFLPVYYTFAAKPFDVTGLNSGSYSYPDSHVNKSHTREKDACNDTCNDTDLSNPDSVKIKYLFSGTGWTFNAILDTNEDGIIDIKDIPLSYDLIENKGNGNGKIDDNEYNNWLSDAEYVGLATYHENRRTLDIPDLVVTDKTVINYGTEI